MLQLLAGSEDPCIGIEVDGRVAGEELKALTSLLEEAIERHGKLRLLVHLRRLGRVDPTALWEDLKFSLSHITDVERLALVGDARWHEAYVELVGPLVPAEVRHFTSDALDEAWRWLRE